MTQPIGGPTLTSLASTLRRTPSTSAPVEPPAMESSRPDGSSQPVDFSQRVEEMLEDVNAYQVDAQQAADSYASGEQNDMHGTMIAMERADIAFRLASNIRGRLIEAYREVMRMGA